MSKSNRTPTVKQLRQDSLSSAISDAARLLKPLSGDDQHSGALDMCRELIYYLDVIETLVYYKESKERKIFRIRDVQKVRCRARKDRMMQLRAVLKGQLLFDILDELFTLNDRYHLDDSDEFFWEALKPELTKQTAQDCLALENQLRRLLAEPFKPDYKKD